MEIADNKLVAGLWGLGWYARQSNAESDLGSELKSSSGTLSPTSFKCKGWHVQSLSGQMSHQLFRCGQVDPQLMKGATQSLAFHSLFLLNVETTENSDSRRHGKATVTACMQ